MKRIYFSTSNEYKFNETKNFLYSQLPTLDVVQLGIDIPEIQHDDPDAVLVDKINFMASKTAKPFIVDDVAFETSRFPGFPGVYAKFINDTLGVDGWKKLFVEGDDIRVISRIGLSYLGRTYVFRGEISGSISFKHLSNMDKKAPLNSIVVVGDQGSTLGEAVKNKSFINHRQKALKCLIDWVRTTENEAQETQCDINERWNKRSKEWSKTIEDQNSYVNFEDNYERVNTLIRKISPVVKGNVLEVGCGTGEAGRIAKEANKMLRVTSIDPAEGMIAEAKKQSKGTGITHKVSDIFSELQCKKRYGMLLSRGVVVSHIPRSEVYDYFEAATRLVDAGGYLLFDFIQDVNKGDTTKPVGLKNELSIEFIDRLLVELGWVKIADDGDSSSRVRVVCYNKPGDKTAYFVTSSPQKIIELSEAINNNGVDIRPLLLEIDEVKSESIEYITSRKLKDAFDVIGHPVMCTDGGIFISSLGGFPGENSKQAATKLGASGIIKLLDGSADRAAVRRNTLGYYDGHTYEVFTAEVPCEISLGVRDVKYPSYELDKVLIPTSKSNTKKLTYCEMPVSERVMFTELPQFAEFINSKLG